MSKGLQKNINIIFWLFAITVAIGLTIPVLIQEGMFMDGMLYTCVARNLGHGIGTFWFPQFSELNVGGLPSFHEQPPLVFGIQAVFFYLFGNSIYIERGYTILMLLIHIYLIGMLWKEINVDNKKQSPLAWFAVILWISIALVFWTFRHNMQENTMGVFTLLSVLFSIRGLKRPSRKLWFFALSGLFIGLAILSKGFPGLFPVGVPFLYWLVYRKPGFGRMFFSSFILIAISVALVGVLLLFPDARQSLSYYFFDRFMHRLDFMPTIDNRFYIIQRLLMELIASGVIVVLLAVVLKFQKVSLITKSNGKLALLFLLIGFSGSVPLCFTMVQKGFYMTPALPFFAIALAFLVAHGLQEAINRISEKGIGFQIFKYFTIILFVSVLAFSVYRIDSYSRHKDMIEDVKHFSTVVPKNATVTIPDELWDEYDFIFQGYMMRYAYISISPYKQYDYYIREKESRSTIPEEYIKVDLPTQEYDLYKRQVN